MSDAEQPDSRMPLKVDDLVRLVNRDVDTEQSDSKTPLEERDRWSYRPAGITLVSVFCLILLCSLPGSFNLLLMLLTVLGLPVAAIFALMFAGRLAIRRKFRGAGSVVVAVLLPILFLKPIFWAALYAHLALTAGLGVGQIGSPFDSPSVSGRDRFIVYDWSVGLLTNPNIFLIYDTTDEIAFPLAQHKYPAASENGFGEECAGKVDHLLGHYYKCTS